MRPAGAGTGKIPGRSLGLRPPRPLRPGPMTDTTAPKRGWFQRLTEGLSRSSKQMTDQVVSGIVKRPLDQAAIDELEEQLIEAALGPAAAARIAERFKALRFGKAADEIEIKESLAEAISAELLPRQERFDPLAGAQ